MEANLLPGDEAVGKEAARYIRFASAAYGMLMLKVLVRITAFCCFNTCRVAKRAPGLFATIRVPCKEEFSIGAAR